MRVLHILSSGDIGGIEILCKDIGQISIHENYFFFVWKGGIIESEMRATGLSTTICGVNGKISFSPIKKIIMFCKGKKIDVVVIHHPSPLLWIYVPMLRFALKSTKIFVYAHNNADNMLEKDKLPKYYLYRILLKRAFKVANGIIAISNSVKQSILNEYPFISNDFVHVVYNGIRLEQFTRSNREKESIVKILYVGRIKKEKGIHLLVDAIKQLPKDVPAFECTIVGDGPYYKDLCNEIKANKLDGSVKAIGAVRNVSEWLHASDVFVHPSVWKEGFGIAIAEALASGLVCIGSDRGAIPELITDQENGFICSVDNSEQLSGILENVIRTIDSKQMQNIREHAYESSKKFGIEKTIHALDSIFEVAIMEEKSL